MQSILLGKSYYVEQLINLSEVEGGTKPQEIIRHVIDLIQLTIQKEVCRQNLRHGIPLHVDRIAHVAIVTQCRERGEVRRADPANQYHTLAL